MGNEGDPKLHNVWSFFPVVDFDAVQLMVRKSLGWRKAEKEGQEQFSQDQDNVSSYKTLCRKKSNPCLFEEVNNIAGGENLPLFLFK